MALRWDVIKSFQDDDSQKLFERRPVRRWPPDLQRRALRKLLILDATEALADLRIPPGNRLEKLTGDRAGQHSIRINDPWRICFRWHSGNTHAVEITDDP